MRALCALFLAFVPAFVAVGSVTLGGGCTQEVDVAQSVDEATAAITFVVLEGAHKSNAPEGVTVIKSKAAYKQFFGVPAPASVSFNKSWVVHVSVGVRNTGGYSVAIDAIQKQKKGHLYELAVLATEHRPGDGCMVTMALTNPQVAVLMNKQPKTSTVAALDFTAVDHDCIEPEPTTCADLGGACLASPFDVTFGANCEEDYGMLTAPSGKCAAFNRTCCVDWPER